MMENKDILYVDDELETGRVWLSENFCFQEKTPEEVFSHEDITSALKGVKIVLMDYHFDENQDGSLSSSERPIDGMELLERFRAGIRHKGTQTGAIPLLALYTGQYDELIDQLDCLGPIWAVSKKANIDWIFKKGSVDSDPEKNTRQLTARWIPKP